MTTQLLKKLKSLHNQALVYLNDARMWNDWQAGDKVSKKFAADAEAKYIETVDTIMSLHPDTITNVN